MPLTASNVRLYIYIPEYKNNVRSPRNTVTSEHHGSRAQERGVSKDPHAETVLTDRRGENVCNEEIRSITSFLGQDVQFFASSTRGDHRRVKGIFTILQSTRRDDFDVSQSRSLPGEGEDVLMSLTVGTLDVQPFYPKTPAFIDWKLIIFFQTRMGQTARYNSAN